MGLGIGQDARAQLFRGRVFDADIQVVAVARGQGQVRVGVHVVQARHAEGALQVMHQGVRALEPLQLGQAGNPHQLAAANGHGLSPGLRRVLGIDATVAKDQVGIGPLRRMGRGKVVGLSHASHLRVQCG
ncbi:hypothetical protein D3C81_1892010 [compost metagenome]